MLVVISIIVLLLTIAIPGIYKARQNALREKSLATVRTLAVCCKAYKQDREADLGVGNINANYPPPGGTSLVTALTTQTTVSGAPANARLAGEMKLYGPYSGVENIPVENGFFRDSFKNPILYYRYNTTTSVYDSAAGDNAGGPPIDAYVGAQYNPKTFVIITAGPDKIFTSFATDATTDDVTNFLPE